MVPMDAQKRKEALHEPQCRAGVPPASVGNADVTEPLALARSLGRRDACPTLAGPAYLRPQVGLPPGSSSLFHRSMIPVQSRLQFRGAVESSRICSGLARNSMKRLRLTASVRVNSRAASGGLKLNE